MICKQCGKMIPSDSKFCPFCGGDIGAPEHIEQILQGDSLVLLEKGFVVKNVDGKITISCAFRSMTDQPIHAMQVDFLCSDIWREPVNSLEGFSILI